MKRLGWIVMLAACGPRAQGGGVGNTAPAGRGGPAPTIAWVEEEGYGHFATERLPAISPDGAQVLFGHQGEDGARGFPNLTLVVKDAHDQVVASRTVLSVDDADAETPVPGPAALDAGNAFLAEGAWNALPAATELQPSDPDQGLRDSESATAIAGAIAIQFDASGRVVVRDGGKSVHQSDHPDWLVADEVIAGGEITCSNPAFLGAAWIDAAHHVALLRISYVGNDTCWEPDSVEHVLSW